jgi:hypothetical protein
MDRFDLNSLDDYSDAACTENHLVVDAKSDVHVLTMRAPGRRVKRWRRAAGGAGAILELP